MEGLGAAEGQPAQTGTAGHGTLGRQDTALGLVHDEVKGRLMECDGGLLQ